MAERRPNGSGSIQKIAKGLWRGQIMDGYHLDGKKNVISFTGRTKSEVTEKIKEYWLQKELCGISYSRKTPFDEWADTWLQDYETEVEASTYSGYQYTARILKEYFRNTPVGDIRALDINHFMDHLLRRKVSKSYMAKCRAMLIQIFDYAEANQLISINPARKAKRIKDKGDAKLQANVQTKDAFTPEEQEFIRKGVQDDLMGHSICVLLGTGLRAQELLALQPADIAEDGSSLSITKAIKMTDGVPYLGPPKSDRGRRIVPIPEKYRADALYLRNHSGPSYIGTSQRESGLFDVGAFRNRYYRYIKKIPGVRPLSPHSFRHTYISTLEQKGIPMEQIARLAGHSRITTTDGYLHTDLGTLTNAVAVLNDSGGRN